MYRGVWNITDHPGCSKSNASGDVLLIISKLSIFTTHIIDWVNLGGRRRLAGGGPQPAEGTSEVGEADTGLG